MVTSLVKSLATAGKRGFKPDYDDHHCYVGYSSLSEGSQVGRVTGFGFRVRVRVSACCDCLTESPLTSIM